MEDNTFRIKKKYVYAGFIGLILIVGFFMYSLGGNSGRAAAGTQEAEMMNGNPSSNSMADHHKPFQEKPSGFFETAVGKKAPDFDLQDIKGNAVKLSGYKGKNIVLFFNEGSMCYPACWNQIGALANDNRFNSDNTISFSIVVDSQAQWKKIMQQVPQLSNSKILFDTTRKASSDYDVLFLESSMHKGTYPGHTYFVIDKEGIIRYTKDDQSMTIRNNELAAELEKL
ncbi:redoxin domain-containing protein [Candidatus Woesearchaeota archaeon]|nr:redoxin domain-containing protein [Candidatus Woesearchaeota archaeon]